MASLYSLIITILPYAIGAAISPLILATLISTVPPENRPRLSAFSYFLGSALFFLILAFSGLYIGSSLPTPILGPRVSGGLIEIILGAILVIISLKTLFIREVPQEGGLLGFIDSLREDNNFSIFIKFFYFGFLTYLASFATSILIAVAGIIIGISNSVFPISSMTIIILGFVALLIVEIPFILYLISPTRAGEILSPAQSWIVQYGDYLMTIVYLILGIFFAARGFMAI